jgi:hypothetical protein
MAARRCVTAVGASLICLLAGSSPVHAVAPSTSRRLTAETLTALPAAGLRAPLRTQVALRYGAGTSAGWSRLVAALGGRWQASWDVATGVPSRIWGEGLAAPGTTSATPASAAAAAKVAWALLADHLAVLAPGAAVSDFELVSNDFDGEIRSIGLLQRAGGRRVVGGQVSFRFKHERLVAIGSEALPAVTAPQVRARVAPAALRGRVGDAVRDQLGLATAIAAPPGDEVVLPLVGDAAVLGYRVATPVLVDAGAEGRFLAYADPATGEVLAVHQQALFTTGTLLYHGVDRNPLRPRIDRPAPRVRVTVGGVAATTTPTGEVSWATAGAEAVTTAVVGDLVVIVNKATSGALASTTLQVPPAGQAVWDASAVVEDDAQLQTLLSINRVKAYVRTFDPALAILDEQTTANVNIAMDCNAFFDGKAVNFFHSNARCQNTGLLEDVVFHEFGHDVHSNEIITGVGSFDGAMSEGAADFLAALITRDSGMGRGFFFDDTPLRELDPVGSEHVWPRDIGEIHFTGMIFGGTFWDLRTKLIASLGEDAGIALVQKLYVGALRRATNIPTSLIEVLIEDDDDGNLANGTPHECDIRSTFARHGLRTASGHVEAPGTLAIPAMQTTIGIHVDGLADRCGGDEITSVGLEWRAGRSGVPAGGSALATPVPFSTSSFYVPLSLPANDVLYYRLTVTFIDGGELVLADNLGDPWYELYQGDTVKLYCTDFESKNPFQDGWTTGTADGTASPWAWGLAGGGATDPSAAYSGSHLLALGLGTDYAPSQTSWVKLPPIDTGTYSDVHLQFRRWLAVEDSHFDLARIYVNGVRAWINSTANKGDNSSIHTIDREWRFQDVAISNFSPDRVLDVTFDLKSDEGLQLGGWQLDDVCVVANRRSACGDGVVSGREQCDLGAGNANVADTCRANCTIPRCGDAIVDTGEACDSGPGGSSTCTVMCTVIAPKDGGGCATTGGDGGLVVIGAAAWLAARRRRVRAKPSSD